MTGAEVRQVRNLLLLTQEAFAARLGVTFSTVSRWENGHVQPSPLAARRIRQLALDAGAVHIARGTASAS